MAGDSVDQPLDLAALGDVGGYEQRFATGRLHLLPCTLAALGVALGEDDARALAGEPTDDGAPDAASSTGDEGDFILEEHGILSQSNWGHANTTPAFFPEQTGLSGVQIAGVRRIGYPVS